MNGRSILGFVLQALGIALLVFGLIWTLQGLGLLDWPPNSFMLGHRIWVLGGLIAMALGGAAQFIGNRLRRG